MKRYAFIDVQNTEATTMKVLGFQLDNERLFVYLKERWECEKVFFYPGIRYDDVEREGIFKRLIDLGAIVRPKYYTTYKIPERLISLLCPTCNTEIKERIKMGSTWKCNCDVELTIDLLENAGADTEILLFTGDGDFTMLIERAIAARSVVSIFSSMKKQKLRGNFVSRFSMKLRKFIEENNSCIRFIELNNLRLRIKKLRK